MNKQELLRDMKQATKGASFMSVEEFARYKGVHPNTAGKQLKGLEYMQEERGKRKYYFVGDLADMILRTLRVGA